MADTGRLLLLALPLFVWSPSCGASSPPCDRCQPVAFPAAKQQQQPCCLNASGQNCQQSFGGLTRNVDFASLQTLDLSRCNLQNAGVIPPTPSMRKIYLAGNNLSSLPESFLGEAEDLSHIYLGENNLRRLPRSLTDRVLASLDAGGNQIECDCALYDSLMENGTSPRTRGLVVICASPENLRNRSLGELSRADVCRSHTALYASLGTVVACLVLAALYLGCKRHLDPLLAPCLGRCSCDPGCVRLRAGREWGASGRVQKPELDGYACGYSPGQQRAGSAGGCGGGGGGGGAGDGGNAESSGQSPYENWPLAQVSSSAVSMASRPEVSPAGFDRRAGLMQLGGAPCAGGEYENLPASNRSRQQAMAAAEAAAAEQEVVTCRHGGAQEQREVEEETESIYANQPAPVHYYSLVPPMHVSDDEAASEQEVKTGNRLREP